jgi:hypothetical protein
VAVPAAGCSAGDPPDPEAAGLPAADAEDEQADTEDAALDALEEQFEDHGVKDIRGGPGAAVTIRLEDELTVADAAAPCAAVRAAGFATVQVDIDGRLAPCP